MNEDKLTMQSIKDRHSVRAFTSEPIGAEVRQALQDEVAYGNEQGKLHMSLVFDEPEAFNSAMAHYGKFSNVSSYLVVAGQPADDLEERAGYWGERVVLLAQSLGLNSCWVGMTFKKRFVKKQLAAGDKLAIVVALGHGETQGVAHTLKPASDVCNVSNNAPAWFNAGVQAALLAPTAMNQQKFFFELKPQADNGKPVVAAKSLGGFFSNVDLGIVKLHFEIGAGKDSFTWA